MHYLDNPKGVAVAITGAVEGDADEAVLKKLIEEIGCWHGPIFGKKGKQFLRGRIESYNAAAHFSPWVVLVDLDTSHACAPTLRDEWLPVLAPMMCFRVAVRSIEAWLLADRERFSDFFHVARNHIPENTDSLAHPKTALVNAIQRSRRKQIREAMVPRAGSGRAVGPAYTSWIIEYAQHAERGWRPTQAALRSDSLSRCMRHMRLLAAQQV